MSVYADTHQIKVLHLLVCVYVLHHFTVVRLTEQNKMLMFVRVCVTLSARSSYLSAGCVCARLSG